MVSKTWNDTIEIDRPAARVWAVLSDPRTGPQWIKGVSAIEPIGSGPPAVGNRFKATRTVQGRVTTEEISVTEMVPEQRYSVGAGLMGGGIELRISYTMTPTANGVRVESATTGTSASLTGRLVFGMFWKAVTENDGGNLRALKQLVEGSGP